MNLLKHGELKASYSEIAVVILFALIAVLAIRSRQKRRRLPPGPSGWPLIGSALSLPKEREWVVYQAWSKIYGAYHNVFPHLPHLHLCLLI